MRSRTRRSRARLAGMILKPFLSLRDGEPTPANGNPPPATPPATATANTPAAAAVIAPPEALADLAAQLEAERKRARDAETKCAEVEDSFNRYKKSVETPKEKKIGIGWFEEQD